MTDTIGRKLEAFLPGPLLVSFGQFIAPFDQKWFIASDYQIDANYVAAGVGLLLSIVMRPILINRGDISKQICLFISAVITILFLSYCFHIWTTLLALPPERVHALQQEQLFCFIAGGGFMCLTISLASLAYPGGYTVFIKVGVATLIFVLIMILGYFFWRRVH